MLGLCTAVATAAAALSASTSGRGLNAADTKRIAQFNTRATDLAHSRDGVLIIDGDNVRGKSGFQISHASLLARTARWAKRRGLDGRTVLLVDHGSQSSAFHLPRMAGMAVAFSGTSASADDVAARDVGWFNQRGHAVVLVTADSGLADRCRRAATRQQSLQIVAPQILLGAIGVPTMTGARGARGAGAGAHPSPVGDPPRGGEADAADDARGVDGSPCTEAQLLALEGEMAARAALTRARRAQRRLGKNPRKVVDLRRQIKQLEAELAKALEASAAAESPSLDAIVLSPSETEGAGDGANNDAVAFQDAVMRALVQRLARRSQAAGGRVAEHTFERVILAEVLRRRLERRKSAFERVPEGPFAAMPAACYATMLNGEVPPPPGSAPQLQRAGGGSAISPQAGNGLVGNVDRLAADAASKGPSSLGSEDTGAMEALELHLAPTLQSASEALPTRTLSVTRWDMKRPIHGVGKAGSSGIKTAKRERRRKRRQQSIDFMHSRPPPTGADKRVVAPRGEMPASVNAAAEEPADVQKEVVSGTVAGASARLAVISDTHGFEDQFGEIPDADVLIHCGDLIDGWPSSGEGDTTKDVIAQLDKWLAGQPPKRKIVVRGNHDPGEAEFPLSGATYVNKPCTIRLDEGLTLAVVPSLRGPLRGALPEGDVLVTHEPPKNVLDRAIGSGNVGDESLRKAVRRLSVKPRLWLCGHIHEAAGAARIRFGKGVEATTVVNAANANPGRARRLIHGPIQIDLER